MIPILNLTTKEGLNKKHSFELTCHGNIKLQVDIQDTTTFRDICTNDIKNDNNYLNRNWQFTKKWFDHIMLYDYTKSVFDNGFHYISSKTIISSSDHKTYSTMHSLEEVLIIAYGYDMIDRLYCDYGFITSIVENKKIRKFNNN